MVRSGVLWGWGVTMKPTKHESSWKFRKGSILFIPWLGRLYFIHSFIQFLYPLVPEVLDQLIFHHLCHKARFTVFSVYQKLLYNHHECLIMPNEKKNWKNFRNLWRNSRTLHQNGGTPRQLPKAKRVALVPRTVTCVEINPKSLMQI